MFAHGLKNGLANSIKDSAFELGPLKEGVKGLNQAGLVGLWVKKHKGPGSSGLPIQTVCSPLKGQTVQKGWPVKTIVFLDYRLPCCLEVYIGCAWFYEEKEIVIPGFGLN